MPHCEVSLKQNRETDFDWKRNSQGEEQGPFAEFHWTKQSCDADALLPGSKCQLVSQLHTFPKHFCTNFISQFIAFLMETYWHRKIFLFSCLIWRNISRILSPVDNYPSSSYFMRNGRVQAIAGTEIVPITPYKEKETCVHRQCHADCTAYGNCL